MRIVSSTLELFCTADEFPAAAAAAQFGRLTVPWNEAFATWTMADSGAPWTVPGGDPDFITVQVVPRALPDAGASWETFDATFWTMDFLSGASQNYGFWLAVESGDGHYYASASSPDSAHRPRLVVVLADSIAVERAAPALQQGLEVLSVDSRRARLFLERAGAYDFRIFSLDGKALFRSSGSVSMAGERVVSISAAFRESGQQAAVAVLSQGGKSAARSFVHLR